MSDDVLTLSARLGGQAEAVLRSIAHDELKGVGEIPDTSMMVRSVFAWTTNDLGQATKVMNLVGFDTVSGPEQRIKVLFPVRLVLGTEVGIVLRDVSFLSRRRNFSTTHMAGTEGGGIDYVMPIASQILTHGSIGNNFRRAVYDICAFLLKHQGPGLLAWREVLQKIEKARLVREAEYAASRQYSRKSRFAGERYVGIW